MDYRVHFEVAAAFFLIAAQVAFSRQKHLKLYRNILFQVMLALATMADFLDVGRWVLNSKSVEASAGMLTAVHTVYYIVFTSFCMSYGAYVMSVLQRLDLLKRYRGVILVPCIAVLLLCLTNPLTGLVFGLENGHMVKGMLYAVVVGIPMFYAVLPMFFLSQASRRVSRIEKRWIVFTPIVMLLGTTVQKICFPHVVLGYVWSGLAIFVCFLFLQNSDYYMDEVTGFFKMHGFEEVAKEKVFYKKSSSYLVIRIMNYNAMTEIYDDNRLTKIRESISKIMRRECGERDFYSIAASTFAVISPSQKESEQIHKALTENLPKIWSFDGEEIVHEYSYYVVQAPEECETAEELLRRIAYARSDHKGHHDLSELVELTRDTVKGAADKQMVADIVEQAIMDNSIEIYFQPIYSLEKGRVTSLEVLSRLKDKDKKFINPEFFISVAEENHNIIQLGEQIYRKACIFATQNHIFEMGIEDININLSPIQCCYEELAQDLIRIAEEYGIPMSRMHLEITESGIMDKVEIMDTLAALRSSGAKIALDDFGTGYSNVSSIVSLPVDFVKIDKSLVWSYGRGENQYLDQLVPMIHSEGKRIISEGIETQEHIDIFKRLKGDFLQGYFYSKPLPEQEFIKYLKEANQIVT